jgi:hypothetical protein
MNSFFSSCKRYILYFFQYRFFFFSLDFTLQQMLLVAAPLVSETLGAVSILLPFIFQLWAQYAPFCQQSLMHPLGSSTIRSFFKEIKFYPLSSCVPDFCEMNNVFFSFWAVSMALKLYPKPQRRALYAIEQY